MRRFLQRMAKGSAVFENMLFFREQETEWGRARIK